MVALKLKWKEEKGGKGGKEGGRGRGEEGRNKGWL